MCPLFRSSCPKGILSSSRRDVPLHVFPSLQVAAVSGDARRALDICRRATEIAQSEEAEKEEGRKKKKSSKENGVSVQHLQKAMVEMFTSSKFNAVKYVL